MAVRLDQEMIASYEVEIDGIARSRAQLNQLGSVIKSLRVGSYGTASITAENASTIANPEIFNTIMDTLEGHLQAATQKAMLSAMDRGKEVQAASLRAATTKTGLSGRPKGRKGPGREVSGELIKQLKRNVEVLRKVGSTLITGWHGWAADRPDYFDYQEKGTSGAATGSHPDALRRVVNKKRKEDKSTGSGVPAANSLGAAIIIVREELKRSLDALR